MEIHKKVENVLLNTQISGNISLFEMITASRTKPECGDSGKLGG